MADELDLSAEREELERSIAVQTLTRKFRERGPGLDRCAICGEPIGDDRKALGAIHCVEHAEELEQRQRHFR